MRMVLRNVLPDAHTSILGTERHSVDGEIARNNLLVGPRSREVVCG